MFQFLKKLYYENVNLIEDFRFNLKKTESYENENNFFEVFYYLNEEKVGSCVWKDADNLFISASSISTSSISTNDLLLFFSILLEELNDYSLIYLTDSKLIQLKLLKKFCSSKSINVEFNNVSYFKIILIRGNLEENYPHEFPLMVFT